jgi:hypothetical protein
MKTELALREFLDSRVSSNLRPLSIKWYKDRLRPFAQSCPNLPRCPEPIEQFALFKFCDSSNRVWLGAKYLTLWSNNSLQCAGET